MTLKTPELREAIKDFAMKARQCADPDVSQMKFERFRLRDGMAFEVSDAAIEAQNTFVRQAIKKARTD